MKPFVPAAVIFDLDGTLLDSETTADETWFSVCQERAPSLSLDAASLLAAILPERDAFWRDEERSRPLRLDIIGARIEFLTPVFAAFGIDDPSVVRGFAERYSELRRASSRMFPGARAVLDMLSFRGLPLALLTNGDGREQRAKVRSAGLESYFRHINVEGETGIGKPDQRVYADAVRALGCEPDQTWMVGDHLELDVRAPQQIGIAGIWIDRAGHGAPDGAAPSRVIREIAELL